MKKILICCIVLLFFINANVYTEDYEINENVYDALYDIKLNGCDLYFDNDILLINNMTYVPLREFSEMLNKDVKYDSVKSQVRIEQGYITNNLYPFKKDGIYGYKNINGDIVIMPQYTSAREFKENVACVGNGKYYGYIDTNGEKVIPFKYTSASSFKNGIARVEVENYTDSGQYMYINKEGQYITNNKFSIGYEFSDGYAAVIRHSNPISVPLKINERQNWTYINTEGDYVSTKIFEDAYSFDNGYAFVKNNGKWGMIDNEFTVVVDYKYNNIEELKNAINYDKLNFGKVIISINGNVENFEYPVFNKRNRTYVSLREICNYYGIDVKWVLNEGKYSVELSARR